jgi:hypothetical protein
MIMEMLLTVHKVSMIDDKGNSNDTFVPLNHHDVNCRHCVIISETIHTLTLNENEKKKVSSA